MEVKKTDKLPKGKSECLVLRERVRELQRFKDWEIAFAGDRVTELNQQINIQYKMAVGIALYIYIKRGNQLQTGQDVFGRCQNDKYLLLGEATLDGKVGFLHLDKNDKTWFFRMKNLQKQRFQKVQ